MGRRHNPRGPARLVAERQPRSEEVAHHRLLALPALRADGCPDLLEDCALRHTLRGLSPWHRHGHPHAHSGGQEVLHHPEQR